MRILYANEAHKRLFGDDIEGRFCYEVYEHRPQICPDCPVVGSFRTGKPVRALHEGQDKHGNELAVEIIATPLRSQAGEIVAGVEVVREVTEQEGVRRELLKKTNRLERLAAVSKEIASGLDLDRVLEQVVISSCDLVGASGGVVALRDEKNHSIVYPYTRGLPVDLSSLSFPEGSGLVGHVMRTGEPLVLDDYSDFTGDNEIFSGEGPRAVIAVPFMAGRKAVGALSLYSRNPEKRFRPDDLNMVMAVADQAAVAIENARLFEETDARLKVRQELSEMAVSISAGLDLGETLSNVARHAARIISADAAMVALYDEEDGTVTFPYAYRLPVELTQISTPLGEGLADSVIRNRSPRIVNDYQSFPHRRPQFARAGVEAVASVPLVVGDRCVGAIGVMDTGSGQQFVRDDIDILTLLSTQAAVAVENARLYAQRDRSAQELEQRVAERTEALSRMYKESEKKGRELEEANERLRELDRLKSEFLANMSHELRTPLNAIMGFSKLILDGLDGEINDEQRRDLTIVHENGVDLLRLIDDLLDLARIEAGRTRVAREEEDPGGLAAEVVMKMSPAAEAAGLGLEYTPGAGLKPVPMDRKLTRQALTNLVGNAIKFSDEGVIDVSVEQRGGETVFSVTDHGPGLEPDQLDAVFDRFHQVRGDLADSQGIGVGLTLSRRFIELQGGRIWAESEPGKGSTFIFSLPDG